ncbi:lisH domain-containing protein C1711.05-like [Drosophila guanche]|uniref:lisH domain-containing protein C1711.05-like n=1 Tax=Drosophila guanche TaxID=7266 RepID=UPI001471AC1A|nr:lisH domain-containing protein C1711.05-like [Drosophila guanche]
MATSLESKDNASNSSGSSQRKNYPSEWTDEMKAALELKSETRWMPSKTSISSISSEHSPSMSSQSEERTEASETLQSEDLTGSCSLHSTDQLASRRKSSISTIGSAHLPLTNSQTSSECTTESSYQTTSADDSTLESSDSSNNVQTIYASAPNNFLREMYVPVDPRAVAYQLEPVRWELRPLLAHEMAVRGSYGEVFYLIGYHYMW